MPKVFRCDTVDTSVLVFSSGEMGKNKQKGKKTKTVFQVANKHLKHKNKAKPVTTTLKHVSRLKGHETVAAATRL